MEIISLGRHKLMCGDATKYEDVLKLIGENDIDLVFTDPPYGNKKIQNRDGTIGGRGNGQLSPCWCSKKKDFYEATPHPQILGNENTNAARLNYEIVNQITEHMIIWGGNYFTDFLPVSKGWIFWDKKRYKCDFGDGELAWIKNGTSIKYYSQLWSGMAREGNCLLNPKPRVHPTQKPVELHAMILEDYSQPGANILDCFGGSGTTLIACEISERNCFMMELSPEYCDIIIDRYMKIKEALPIFSN